MKAIDKNLPFHIEPSGRKRYHLGTCIDCGNPTMQKSRSRCRPCAYKFKTNPPNERFWKFVRKTTTCWLWTGAKLFGYGIFGTVRAHRFSWEMHNGKIESPKTFVCHHCDVRNCVNPSHLFLGTCADNSADQVSKKRHTFGMNHPMAKLTDEKVKKIRAMYVPRKVTSNELAKRFDVSHATIQLIVTNKIWRHIL